MGKKKLGANLGKSIIRDRFGQKLHVGTTSHLHTSELQDGCDWNRINLRSVTEETSLDEFIATAELAGTEFAAEKLNLKFVSQDFKAGLLSEEEEIKVKSTQDEHRIFLKIPRRPVWDKDTTTEELDLRERTSFLEWRRNLAKLQDVEGIVMTPFEKNLDFWRQLWRVIERSDIIVQIVDCRNPLLFRSSDLEEYVKEVKDSKVNLILVNKADYLTQQQREKWTEFFDQAGLRVVFWSAVDEMERIKAAEAEDSSETVSSDASEEDTDDDYTTDSSETDEPEADTGSVTDDVTCAGGGSSVQADDACDTDEDHSLCSCTLDETCHNKQCSSLLNIDRLSLSSKTRTQAEENVLNTKESVNTSGHCGDMEPSVKNENIEDKTVLCPENHEETNDSNITSLARLPMEEKCCGHTEELGANTTPTSVSDTDHCAEIRNNSKILTGPELLEFFKSVHTGKKYTSDVTTVGLVGYPNVGKSSTINALLQMKKVPVSATPGRTKHFQTLFVEPSLMLCDCPGLVMPTFVNTKADMVLNGILPIDQMRDYVPPVALMNKLIPRQVLEAIYGIMIPKPRDGEDEDRPPTAHELLGAYGFMRGYMTHKGIPDFQRSSRHVLKDFVKGKLLYCTPPPGANAEDFCCVSAPLNPAKDRQHPQQKPVGSRTKGPVYNSEVDQSFFQKKIPSAGSKGVGGGLGYLRKQGYTGAVVGDSTSAGGSPHTSTTSLSAKPWKKHHNYKKKEKLRRINSYLDA